MIKHCRIIILAGLLSVLVSCNTTEVKEPVEYNGPARIGTKVEMFYTERELLKVKMLADEVHEFQTGDREFPKGIYMEFYDDNGKLESTLRSNQAYYFKTENKWRATGKVEVKNEAKDEQLNTEELFWKPNDKRIFTDQFVTIRQQSDVIYGEGLEANQDMSDWYIKKPTGSFEVSEEGTENE